MLISDIARAVGCLWTAGGAISRVVTDSRQAGPETLFVAIVGDRLDGNEFAAQALAAGAPAVVVSRRAEGVDPARAIEVPDTKRALIQIGGLYRERFSIPMVGVTGSVGKTTTKEFIHAVLSAKYNTHKNEGNQNNELGVPNTLFALEPTHQAAVVEMGMSDFGEIHALSMAVRPAVGVITAIGVSHIERLGSRENILKAKLELLDGLTPGAPLLLCGDNELLARVRDDRFTILLYGLTNPENQIRAEKIVSRENATSFEILSPWGEYSAKIPTVGQHNV
ncbi:MAG: UDP-N-acetylmuramoyl-tripeptide--D-alanyl-D-alanine ligase, partial [Oscillospiraceae bacterium]